MKRVRPLLPVPKVLVPFVAGCFALAAKVIVTGELDREEVAGLVTLLGYAVTGYVTPESK